MEFQELANLRRSLKEILQQQVESLKQYYDKDSGGFYHRHDKPTPGDPSKSSTATCVLSLVATGSWNQHKEPWKGDARRLADRLLREEWTSAGLPTDNPFTVGFTLEAVTALATIDPAIETDPANQATITKAEGLLTAAVENGGASIQGYPPSAYVTQLVVRTLLRRKKLSKDIKDKVRRWAIDQTQHQLSLLLANNKTADVFQVAYSVVIVGSLTEPADASPDDAQIMDAAIGEFFSRQRPDGTWPLSRPLFHYPTVGSAHCFDYELLVQLIGEPNLEQRVLKYIDKLATAATGCRDTSYRLAANATGWSSGHHPQVLGPESWSTASVYHFAHVFERLLAEQIRRSTFEYLNVPYRRPEPRTDYPDPFENGFLDCIVVLDGVKRSLKTTVNDKILKPIIEEEKRHTVESGGKLAKTTPMSMIFFGPPGTSKTTLAEKIRDVLGWPLLAIDPSQFVKEGIDGVYAEANRVFGMLAILERVVVLLDEFDEMVRERGSVASDSLSRFLTTAMLPKLIKINENRRLLVIVATNHLEAFDVAISRPGRFDAILQVMPPTSVEKVKRWPVLKKTLTVAEQKKKLTPLTYAECELLANKLNGVSDATKARKLIDHNVKVCILNSKATKTKKWSTICAEQASKSRVP